MRRKRSRQPLTLAPLSFEEAVTDILKVKPAPKLTRAVVGDVSKPRNKKGRTTTGVQSLKPSDPSEL